MSFRLSYGDPSVPVHNYNDVVEEVDSVLIVERFL